MYPMTAATLSLSLPPPPILQQWCTGETDDGGEDPSFSLPFFGYLNVPFSKEKRAFLHECRWLRNLNPISILTSPLLLRPSPFSCSHNKRISMLVSSPPRQQKKKNQAGSPAQNQKKRRSGVPRQILYSWSPPLATHLSLSLSPSLLHFNVSAPRIILPRKKKRG